MFKEYDADWADQLSGRFNNAIVEDIWPELTHKA